MIVYKVTNIITKKVYIGQTVASLSKRWGDHCSKGSNCTHLSRSIKKHGKENFTIEQIDSAETIEELNKKEEFWINHYNSTDSNLGYNLRSGGDSKVCHEDTKKRIGNSNKGKKRSEETKELFRNLNLGKKQSPETIEKRRQALLGKKRTTPNPNKGKKRDPEIIRRGVETRKKTWSGHTEEAKRKMSESRKGKKRNPEINEKVSQKLKGVPKSEEAKLNMSKARKGVPTGRKLSEEEIQRREETKRRNKEMKNASKKDQGWE